MVPHAGANAGLLPEDVPTELFTPDAHLHLSGYALLNEGSRAAALHAIEAARTAGATVSVDAASAGPITDVGAATFLAWIDGVDALLTNTDEANALTGLADPASAAHAHEAFASPRHPLVPWPYTRVRSSARRRVTTARL